MNLHTLKSFNKKTGQRIGRGGKRGTTSGRGTKGQKSRSGHRIRPALRDLIIRLPKHRGFRNKPLTAPARVIDLAVIAKKAVAMKVAVIDRTFLRAAGLIPAGYRGPVKILGSKVELKTALTMKGMPASKSVVAQVEKAGGKIVK
jgi:large subunit ribosomal protein L15